MVNQGLREIFRDTKQFKNLKNIAEIPLCYVFVADRKNVKRHDYLDPLGPNATFFPSYSQCRCERLNALFCGKRNEDSLRSVLAFFR